MLARHEWRRVPCDAIETFAGDRPQYRRRVIVCRMREQIDDDMRPPAASPTVAAPVRVEIDQLRCASIPPAPAHNACAKISIAFPLPRRRPQGVNAQCIGPGIVCAAPNDQSRTHATTCYDYCFDPVTYSLGLEAAISSGRINRPVVGRIDDSYGIRHVNAALVCATATCASADRPPESRTSTAVAP